MVTWKNTHQSLAAECRPLYQIKKPVLCLTNYVKFHSALIILVMISFVLNTQQIQAAENNNAITKQVESIPIRGIVRPWARANISADVVARVMKISFKEGEAFRKGDLLIQLDCRHKKAELRSSEAHKREIMVSLKSALFLKKRRAGSRNDVDIARARVDRASADSDAIRYRLKACDIYAPFDGRIARLDIQEHEMPSKTKPFLSIVALENPQIELVVPSTWLSWLNRGKTFTFSVDETGRSYNGKVLRLGATVIAVNQTIKVFAKFITPGPEILPGMSGTAKFSGIGE